MQIISFSIDLAKLDKSKITKTEKGQQFYQLTAIVNDSADKYGKDVQIIEPQTKADREAKNPRIFLGNGKVVFSNYNQSSQANKDQQNFNQNQNSGDDLPF